MIITLKVGDIVQVDNRLYKVNSSKWANQSEWMAEKKNKRGDYTGFKIGLKLLREKDLNELLIKQEEKTCDKCGIKNDFVRFEGSEEGFFCDKCLYELKGGKN